MAIEDRDEERVLRQEVLYDLHRVLHVRTVHCILVLLVGDFVVEEVGVVAGEVGTGAFVVDVARGAFSGGRLDQGADGFADMIESGHFCTLVTLLLQDRLGNGEFITVGGVANCTFII